MSFGELIVIVIIAIFVIKPEDLPIIMKKLLQLQKSFRNFKNNALSYIEETIEADDKKIIDDVNDINFYLQKIISIEGNYEGEYSKKAVKDKYQEIIKNQIEIEQIKDKQK